MGSNNISAPSLVLIHSAGLMKNSNERHSSLFSSTAKKLFCQVEVKYLYSNKWMLIKIIQWEYRCCV